MSATAPHGVTPAIRLRAMVRLVRVPQWTKNGFVLAPLFFSQTYDDGSAVVDALAATVVFTLVASIVYVLNDYTDRERDRRHPRKRERPLASGLLSGRDAILVATVCAVAAVAVALLAGLPGPFWITIACYVGINLAYTTWLRSVTLIDVSVIAAGFVLRVLAGTTAIDVAASQWIVLSTGLLALLLALGKRRSDLNLETEAERASLQGYTVEFIDAAVTALSAAVIGFYALFTVSAYSRARFHSDYLYITTFWVAIGVVRYMQVVMVEGRHGSPTDIALRDRPIQVIVIGWLVTFYILSQ
jgi:decaprenyl-phosphate phosphoribosyltransferase